MVPIACWALGHDRTGLLFSEAHFWPGRQSRQLQCGVIRALMAKMSQWEGKGEGARVSITGKGPHRGTGVELDQCLLTWVVEWMAQEWKKQGRVLLWVCFSFCFFVVLNSSLCGTQLALGRSCIWGLIRVLKDLALEKFSQRRNFDYYFWVPLVHFPDLLYSGSSQAASRRVSHVSQVWVWAKPRGCQELGSQAPPVTCCVSLSKLLSVSGSLGKRDPPDITWQITDTKYPGRIKPHTFASPQMSSHLDQKCLPQPWKHELLSVQQPSWPLGKPR
jgi:hypothetical protein